MPRVFVNAGKTTLLDILAGRKAHGTNGGFLGGGRQKGMSSASGEVRINGRLVDARTLCHSVG